VFFSFFASGVSGMIKASSSDAGILPEETRGETSLEATDDDDAPGRVDDGA